VLRHENVREMMAKARSFRVMDCICRTEKAALGEPCSHPIETCLSFSREPEDPDGFPPWGRPISREEAYEVLDRAEQDGLVHCTYNLQKQHMFVCNCCSCCCGFLRGVKEFDAPHLLVRSNFVALIDGDECIACGVCADERCPMDAIEEGDDVYEVLAEQCIGCGVCTVDCPTEALTLVARPEEEQTVPPKHLVDWSFKRAVQRAGPIRAMVQFGGLTIDAMRARKG
jgi:NAD-dependent dihydropyrimidine dehydrogenase PreA subunit